MLNAIIIDCAAPKVIDTGGAAITLSPSALDTVTLITPSTVNIQPENGAMIISESAKTIQQSVLETKITVKKESASIAIANQAGSGLLAAASNLQKAIQNETIGGAGLNTLSAGGVEIPSGINIDVALSANWVLI